MEAGTLAPPTGADDGQLDESEPVADRDDDLYVEGSSGQLSLKVGGGKEPTQSSIRFLGGKLDVEGEFKKGEVVRVLIEARVNEVAFVDREDPKTRQVTGVERRHRARIVAIERAE